MKVRVTRRPLIALGLVAAVATPVVAAPVAEAATPSPKIRFVSPMRVQVGKTITIRGSGFSSNRRRNTVIFRGVSGRSVFAKPTRASRTRLVVKVPAAVQRILRSRSGRRVATRLRLQVATRRIGKRSATNQSPVVLPLAQPQTGGGSGGSGGSGGAGGGGGTPAPVCTPTGTDFDSDLLPNTVEDAVNTDPCDADTDGDGVTDGFELQSAKDLNNDESQIPNTSLPYPGKRPYPNPLDPTDGATDYDGDSLTQAEEHRAWRYTIATGGPNTLTPLGYSDGEQFSVYQKPFGDDRRAPALLAAGYAKQTQFLNWATGAGYRNVRLTNGSPSWLGVAQVTYALLDFNRDGAEANTILTGYDRSETRYYDFNNDGFLSDNERDEDADGLTNYDETHGRMTPGWWQSCYSGEASHGVHFAAPDFLDSDSDGDTVRDGADDQDHDDIPNVMELSRVAASGLDDRKKQCVANDDVGEQSNFTVTGGPLPNGSVVITFKNEFANLDVPEMTANGAALNVGGVAVSTLVDGGPGVSEKQAVTMSGGPTAGGFTLTLNGKTTPQIAYDASAAQVQEALDSVLEADAESNHPNAYGRINPFNPCLPASWSRTCELHPEFSNAGAPFDDSTNWLSLN